MKHQQSYQNVTQVSREKVQVRFLILILMKMAVL